MSNSVKIIGHINLDKKKRSVSCGAKVFLKSQVRDSFLKERFNRIWGGFLNRETAL